MSDWLEHSDNANTLKSSYIQGVLDVSGNIITRNNDQTFINMSDASFNRKLHALKNTAIGKEVDNLENALDVSGNVGITGSLVLEEAPTIYGSLNTDQLSIEGNLITTGGTSIVASKNVTYDTHLNVHDSTITVNRSEINKLNINTSITTRAEDIENTLSANFTGNKLSAARISYDGNVLAINCSQQTNTSSQSGLMIFQHMYLTQQEWDARTKILTNIDENYQSNIILTDDTTLDTSKKYWTQLGSSINDYWNDRYIFANIDLNGNGTRIAIYQYNSVELSTGGVNVYEYSIPGLLGGTWNKIVPNNFPPILLNGKTAGETSSYYFHSSSYTRYKLNYSGNRIAISYSWNNPNINPDSIGLALVYEYSGTGTDWNLIGEFYNDNTSLTVSPWSNGKFCYRIDLNKSQDSSIDGTVLVLSHYDDPEGYESGEATGSGNSFTEVYKYSGGTVWNKLGGNIYGPRYGPHHVTYKDIGSSTVYSSAGNIRDCSITHDGKTVALTYFSSNHYNTNQIRFGNHAIYSDSGHSIIYELRKLTQSEWDNGNTSTYYSYFNIPLIMTDGDTTLDLNKEYWIQKGNSIDGEGLDSYNRVHGKIVSLPDNNDMFFITGETTSNGRLILYKYINNDWEIIFYTRNNGFYVGSAGVSLSCYGESIKFVSGNDDTNKEFVYVWDLNNIPDTKSFYHIYNDVSMVNAAESFGEDVSLNAGLIVPGNILIVDSSNSEYNYGAYTIHTDETYTNYFAVGKSASNVFNIVNNNNAGVYMDSGSNSFTGTSDRRLKKNIEEIEEESNDKVKQLRPVTYQWKHQTHDKSQAGFIAQEVEKVLPELVKENDSIDGAKYKGVSSDDLIPYLVKYVQKLRKKLEILKETKLKKNVSLSEISVSTNGESITPSPFSSTDELK